jgi:hypothetical protein
MPSVLLRIDYVVASRYGKEHNCKEQVVCHELTEQ